MVRRYDEVVQVRTTDEASTGAGENLGAVPAAFVWRSRPYLVREVLAHWYERRDWWNATESAESAESAEAGGDAECQVWRVEAMAGRSSPVGVYDLTQHPGDGRAVRWLLTRLDD